MATKRKLVLGSMLNLCSVGYRKGHMLLNWLSIHVSILEGWLIAVRE